MARKINQIPPCPRVKTGKNLWGTRPPQGRSPQPVFFTPKKAAGVTEWGPPEEIPPRPWAPPALGPSGAALVPRDR